MRKAWTSWSFRGIGAHVGTQQGLGVHFGKETRVSNVPEDAIDDAGCPRCNLKITSRKDRQRVRPEFDLKGTRDRIGRADKIVADSVHVL